MTKEEFKQSGWKCTYEEWQKFNCSKCDKKECIHRNAYRRLPVNDGGLGLCLNLNEK